MFRRFVISVVKKIFLLINQFNWYIQYSTVLKNTNKKIVVNNTIDGKILIMVPHADDELIGCYSIIQSHEDVHIFYLGYTGSNNAKENYENRLAEINEFCNTHNVNITVANDNVREEFESVIMEFKPNIIAVPSFIDWHEEHIKVSSFLLNYLESWATKLDICMYQVSVPISLSIVTHLIPIKKNELQEKWAEFKRIYMSQKHMPIKRYVYQERIAGSIIGSYAAERFIVLNRNEWIIKYSSFCFYQKELQIEMMKSSINNLLLITAMSDNAYKKIF